MSLRKCEKLKAPNKLKRVCATGATAKSAVILFAMPRTLRMCDLSASRTAYPTSYFVACPERMRHETLRALCRTARCRHSLGRAGIHRGHWFDRVSGRDLARTFCAFDRARGGADFPG